MAGLVTLLLGHDTHMEMAASRVVAIREERRAAFKTGVKPSQIARQFGVSKADVRNALASGESKLAALGFTN
jgi:hypothetical protein